MLTKDLHGFRLLLQSAPDGITVKVSDGTEEIKIPLLPDAGQIARALTSLEQTPIDPGTPLDYFSMIVAGCLMIKMKRPEN